MGQCLYLLFSMPSLMPERENNDPKREAQKIGTTLAHQINANLATLRGEATRQALEKGTTTPEIIVTSATVAEAKRDEERVTDERLEKEKGRRRACLSAIREKLKARGTPIDDTTASILSIVMEKTPGEWNEYDGDPDGVDLGKIDFDPTTQTITIRFEAYGYELGKRIITLRP